MPAWGKYWVIYISLKLRLGAICMKLTIVIKILLHFCSQKRMNASMSYYFPSPRNERDYVLYKMLCNMWSQVSLSML